MSQVGDFIIALPPYHIGPCHRVLLNTLAARRDQYSAEMAYDRPVTILALGRQGFSLGCLYDLSTYQIYARKLWDEEELADDKLNIQEHGTSLSKIDYVKK